MHIVFLCLRSYMRYPICDALSSKSQLDRSARGEFGRSLRAGFDRSLRAGFDRSLRAQLDGASTDLIDKKSRAHFARLLRGSFERSLRAQLDRPIRAEIDRWFRAIFSRSARSDVQKKSSFSRVMRSILLNTEKEEPIKMYPRLMRYICLNQIPMKYLMDWKNVANIA